jgi:ubiquinone/menaquinone biosynthesis C-methylase UbiE
VERYVLEGGRAGYGRLQVLARARRAETVELVRRAGLRPGMRCLDLGCGGGEVTFELASLAGPAGAVTGMDMDEVNLALAQETARQRGIANVEFVAANVNDWDEPGTYDLVYCRFLLQHLSQPTGLLRRMWAAVRPGGAIAVEDTDFDGLFCDPHNDGFEFHKQMYPRVLEHHGGDARIGRKLYRYFLQAGIPDPGLHLVQSIDAAGEAKALALLTLQASAEAIVSAALASAGEVSAAIEDLAVFTAAPDTVVSGPRILQVSARRPAGTKRTPSRTELAPRRS